MLQLSDLGERICILGPSNSGKSTLAHAIGQGQNLPVIHLDQLYHLPHTDWQPRPADEFIALHDAAIAGDRWVMDGNYSVAMPRRLQRATGVILLDVSTRTSLIRYVYRTLFQRYRHGGLAGQQDSLKWEMIHHIAIATPRNRFRNTKLFAEICLPKIRLTTAHERNQYYQAWGIDPQINRSTEAHSGY